MDIFDKLSETITSKSKDLAKKAKDLAEVVSLNSKITTQEDMIQKTYLEIGQKYYEKYKTDLSTEFGAECEIITNAFDEIAKIKSEIQARKNYKVCLKCGEESDLQATYCSKCGAQFEVESPEERTTETEPSEEGVEQTEGFYDKEEDVYKFGTKYENNETN